jgi:hypothetical protein
MKAIDVFVHKAKYRDALSHVALSQNQLLVLDDIRTFLRVPHGVQELVSGEKTPTLSVVLPLYEKLNALLGLLINRLPRLAYAIEATKAKLAEYLKKSRKARIYALAMGMSACGGEAARSYTPPSD